jgi:predicted methyltransferase family protein
MAAKMAERNANYLAHEFLNEYWTPFYSVDVADDMAEAKLNFVGSATLAENHLELLGNEDVQAKIKAQPTQRLRQLFQDLAQNQRFRRDVFVRGHAQLNRVGTARNMEQQVFGAVRDLKNVTNVAKVARGEVKFDEQAFPVLKEAFQQGTWSTAELRKEMAARKLMHVDVERTTALLVATGIAVPCAVASRPGPIPAHPKRINIPSPVNRALVKRMVDNLAAGNLVSPLAGNAMSLDPIFAVILSAAGQPWKDQDEFKERIFGEVKRRRLRFNKPAKEEKPLDDMARAAQFLDRFWADEAPVLHRLGVIEIGS